MDEPTNHDCFRADIEAVRSRLSRPLPGSAAMLGMSPSQRPFTPIELAREAGCREACALVLLYPCGSRAFTVLTLRTGNLREHAGQVSLPGGSLDAGEGVADCALREGREELGIPADRVEVLGQLTPLHIGPTNFCLSPVVAALAQRPAFEPHAPEVAEVIELPLDALLDPSNRSVETWRMRGVDRRVPFYAVGNHKIWGATAMVLGELAAIWRDVRATGAGTRDQQRGTWVG